MKTPVNEGNGSVSMLMLGIFMVVTFMMCYSTHWCFDNVIYQYNWKTGAHISSFGSIIESQIVHYFEANGRTFCHVICQAVLGIGSILLYSVLAAAMNVLFVCLLLRCAGTQWRNPSVILTGIILAMVAEINITFSPVYQIGYVWMTTLVLFFVYIFCGRAAQTAKTPVWVLVIAGLLSVIVGNAHESINIGIGAAMIFYALRRLRRLTSLQWVMFFCFGAGALMLCLAPGILKRAGEQAGMSPGYTLYMCAMGLRIFPVTLAVAAYKIVRGRMTLRQFYKDNSFYIDALAVLLLFHLAIGVGAFPQLFGVEALSSVILVRILKNHSARLWVAIPVLAAVAIIYGGIYHTNKIEARRFNELTSAVLNRDSDTIFFDRSGWMPRDVDVMVRSILIKDCDNMYCRAPRVLVYPEEFRAIKDLPAENRCIEYGPGEYMLLQDKANPAKFFVHRRVSLLGLGKEISPYQVTFDEDSHYNTDKYYVTFISPSMKMVYNTGVTIE